MSDKVGYGSLAVGILMAVGALFYRIAASNAGGPPPLGNVDRQAVRVATLLMFAGGAVTVVGGIAAYLLGRRKS